MGSQKAPGGEWIKINFEMNENKELHIKINLGSFGKMVAQVDAELTTSLKYIKCTPIFRENSSE